MTPKASRRMERQARRVAKGWGPVRRKPRRPSDQWLGWTKGMVWYDVVPERERARRRTIVVCLALAVALSLVGIGVCLAKLVGGAP